MKELKFYFTIFSNTLQIYQVEYKTLNAFLSDNQSRSKFSKLNSILKELKMEPKKIIERFGEWANHEKLGMVGYFGGNPIAWWMYKDDYIYIETKNYISLNIEQFKIDEVIEILNKYINIFQLWESDESFTTYPNLLNLIQKKYHKKITSWGFRLISQFDNSVSYKKDLLVLNFLEDQEGPILYLIDERINQRYDFNLALELLDHYAATIHSMLYQKYKLKLSKEEVRSGFFVKTMEYLESHLLDKVQAPDETFFRELENERQLRNKMLQKVFTLPKDHPIKQRFLNEDKGWWDEMREMMLKDD